MLRGLLSLLLMVIATSSMAQRVVMEGVNASKYTVKIDTINARVLIGTTSYTGSGISNVGLFVASNVVVGNLTNKNACTIYSTGSVNCINANMSGSLVVGSSITAGSSVTASAFFGDGSHLSGVATGVVFTSTYGVAGTDRALSTTPVGITTCTLTTSGGRLRFNVVADLHVASANDKPKLGITIDGAFMDPYSTFSGVKRFNVWGNNNGADSNGSFSFDTTAVVAAGAHTFVLVGYAETGTSIVYCGSAVDHPYCLMQVTETK